MQILARNHKIRIMFFFYVCLNDENKYLVPTKHFTPTFRHSMVPFSRFLVNLTFNQVSSLNPNCENSCMQIQNSKLHLPGTLNHIAQHNKITNITFKDHFSNFLRIRPLNSALNSLQIGSNSKPFSRFITFFGSILLDGLSAFM